MRLLLPPSETKLKGGQSRKGLPTLSFSVQDPVRRSLMGDLESWCHEDPEVAAKALKLGPKSIEELGNNEFVDAPVMPTVNRYTGVLYSATGATEWTAEQREWAANHVFVHSALFGVISSSDEIPTYRLSHDTKIRRISLKKYWSTLVSDAIREMAAGDWVLDCRSEGYRSLAPIPADVPSAYLEVVSANGGKALNHFNKVHKGELVRALVADSPVLPSSESLVDWARARGMSMSTRPGNVTLAI